MEGECEAVNAVGVGREARLLADERGVRLTGGGLPVEPHRVQTGDSDEQSNSVFLEAGRARMVSAPQSWCWRGAVMRRD